ncbi:MAG: 4-hydroxy-tetrahydrodipicolinate reductase [Flavobacteriaceae bacterium]|tara:strand:+ start:4209 stop:4913 length:705 start_codon:yes stop_codon:yes gene_type:complete
MKIALLGYGKMGKAIEKIALKRNHEIIFLLDKNIRKGKLSNADVAINFSIPDSAYNNIMMALELKIPVVSGTTGWLKSYDRIKKYCFENNLSFLYSSNFSIGVNLFFKINQYLAKLMNNYKEYKVKIDETHNINKLDKPSGTAISIAEDIISNSDYNNWKLSDINNSNSDILINSIRKDDIPGTHKIKYSSEIDEIIISHIANSREGFAFGAIIAAEWLINKKGVFNMNDVLDI